MRSITERLDNMEQRLRDTDFRHGRGLSGEVSYYVFDYDPKDELKVRERVRELEETDTEYKFGYQLAVYDLYEVMLRLLADEDVLDDLKNLEAEEGTDYVFTTIGDVLRFEEDDNQIIQYIVDHTPQEPDTVVFLTGIGKCYPVLRSHKILNNLHQIMDFCPVVLFFPGRYTGSALNIFGEVKGDANSNYYRAFPLVEH